MGSLLWFSQAGTHEALVWPALKRVIRVETLSRSTQALLPPLPQRDRAAGEQPAAEPDWFRTIHPGYETHLVLPVVSLLQPSANNCAWTFPCPVDWLQHYRGTRCVSMDAAEAARGPLAGHKPRITV
jgi:hypothetical protein